MTNFEYLLNKLEQDIKTLRENSFIKTKEQMFNSLNTNNINAVKNMLTNTDFIKQARANQELNIKLETMQEIYNKAKQQYETLIKNEPILSNETSQKMLQNLHDEISHIIDELSKRTKSVKDASIPYITAYKELKSTIQKHIEGNIEKSAEQIER